MLAIKSPEVLVVAGRCARLHIERYTLPGPWITPAWKVCVSIYNSKALNQEKWRLIYEEATTGQNAVGALM